MVAGVHLANPLNHTSCRNVLTDSRKKAYNSINKEFSNKRANNPTALVLILNFRNKTDNNQLSCSCKEFWISYCITNMFQRRQDHVRIMVR